MLRKKLNVKDPDQASTESAPGSDTRRSARLSLSGKLPSGRLRSGRLPSGRLPSGRLKLPGGPAASKGGAKTTSGRIGSGRLAGGKLTLGHVNATPFRFQLDIFISAVQNIKESAGEIVVVYERRNLLMGTRPLKVTDKTATFKENISVEATLFKRGDAGGAEFDQKMAKFAVRLGKPDGKTVGKVHVNVAEFVRVPSGSVFKDLTLSNGSVIAVKFDSRLVSSGKRKKKGDDASSVASGMSAFSTGSGGLDGSDTHENESDCSFLDDLDDLDVDAPGESAESMPSAAASVAESSKSERLRKASSRLFGTPSPGSQDTTPMARSSEGKAKSREENKKAVSAAQKEGQRSSRRLSDLSTSSEAVLTRKKSALTASFEKDDYMAKQVKVLEEERDELLRKNKALEEQLRAVDDDLDGLYEEIESLETELAERRQQESRQRVANKEKRNTEEEDELEAELVELEAEQEALMERNKELLKQLEVHVQEDKGASQREAQKKREQQKREKREKMSKEREKLRKQLERDQRFLSIVNDLKEAKMTLAFMSMDKDQALLELRSLQQALGIHPGPSASVQNYRTYGGYGGFS